MMIVLKAKAVFLFLLSNIALLQFVIRAACFLRLPSGHIDVIKIGSTFLRNEKSVGLRVVENRNTVQIRNTQNDRNPRKRNNKHKKQKCSNI
jgi:hypothetical protein